MPIPDCSGVKGRVCCEGREQVPFLRLSIRPTFTVIPGARCPGGNVGAMVGRCELRTSSELKDSQVGTRLLHFIKEEKPYFEPWIELTDLKKILAVRPKQTNRRILAQQGASLIFGLQSTLRDSNDFEIKVIRRTVPAASKRKLLHELDAININSSSLFLEIESAARYIVSKIAPFSDADEKPD